jgi:hypothetical protein
MDPGLAIKMNVIPDTEPGKMLTNYFSNQIELYSTFDSVRVTFNHFILYYSLEVLLMAIYLSFFLGFLFMLAHFTTTRSGFSRQLNEDQMRIRIRNTALKKNFAKF